jgi:predicted phosphodiesterase
MRVDNKVLGGFLIACISVSSLVMIFTPYNHVVNRSEGYLFTFAQITDTQFSGSSSVFENTTLWLAQKGNVSFVVHTGDIVGSLRDEGSWKNAYNYMHQLDSKCAWGVLAGDDDVSRGNQVDMGNFEKYFGSNSADQYFIIKDKLLFILFSWINVDGSISKERLEWMDNILQMHSDLPAVICLHPTLFGLPIITNVVGTPNEAEIWTYIKKHENVIMILSGHAHYNWIRVRDNGKKEVWCISTEWLNAEGYVRLFDVYGDRIEVYAYSSWKGKSFSGPLDCFTVSLNSSQYDSDGDLWSNGIDIMPTHPMVPNVPIFQATLTTSIIIFWVKNRKADKKTETH